MKMTPIILLLFLAQAPAAQDTLTLIKSADTSLSPIAFNALPKERKDAMTTFITAIPGKGFTADQRAYLKDMWLVTDAATITAINRAAPKNFRVPSGKVTLAGEVLLPFDLVSDPANYAWAIAQLRTMPVVHRDKSKFPVKATTPIGDTPPIKEKK